VILFAFEAYKVMETALEKATGLTSGHFSARRFENGELHVDVQTPVRHEDCFILGSIAPPDEQMLTVLLLAHTLKKEGSGKVAAIFPYLAYDRHDKDKPGESLATAWVGAVARASGIDQVIAVDVHSERGRKLFPIPVVSFSPAHIFAQALSRFGLTQATIVAPDEGAIKRCEEVKKAAGMAPERVPYFEKQRGSTGIAHSGLIGDVGSHAVIIDDILDTGGTLVSACEKLRDVGVSEINIMVTHGLFTGERWKKLWQLGVTRIFCTDSVPITREVDGSKIERLSIVSLLAQETCAHATT
jgi:ribose-phosphate pyrophosphokinase